MTMRHAAGGAGQVDAERDLDEQVEDERRSDRPDDGPDGGTAPAIKGTSLGGPTGATVVGVSDGTLEPQGEPGDDERTSERS